MSRGPDAGTLLTRAMTRAALHAGCGGEVTFSDWERWSSATFTGARHRLTLTGEAGSGFDAFLAGLGEHEFILRGHVVADVVVTRIERAAGAATASIEALTVETG